MNLSILEVSDFDMINILIKIVLYALAELIDDEDNAS